MTSVEVILNGMEWLSQRGPQNHFVDVSADRFSLYVAQQVNVLISSGRISFHQNIGIKQIRWLLWDAALQPRFEALHAQFLEGQSPAQPPAIPPPRPVVIALEDPPRPPHARPVVIALENNPGWKVVLRDTEPDYYWHEGTGRVQWDDPREDAPAQSSPPAVEPPEEGTLILCPLCLDNVLLSRFMVAGCGHGLCMDCQRESYQRGRTTCCVCRQVVAHWIRLYL